ncbi:MAG: Phosphoenolpyruvate synthase [Microgenomates group bacterium Gr01-1014_7]|nr:MAG: Phosphoenolpyruvate synthase [Microgenomates group bacterium Gr01-1014_7]
MELSESLADKPIWRTLLTREGVDITTLSVLNEAFYKFIWEYTKTRDLAYFTHFKDRVFTHYIALDHKEVGRSLRFKYFPNQEVIKKLYSKGLVILKKAKKDDVTLSKISSPGFSQLKELLADFYQGYREINFVYSIAGWLAIEAWQSDFEELLEKLIRHSNLTGQSERIKASVYKPWKKTALPQIQEKQSLGISPRKLAGQYQFLRSWTLIWYKPITVSWIRNLAVGNQVKQEVYTKQQLKEMLKPNKQEWEMIELTPYLTFFKDWRDDLRRAYVYNWSFLFDKIAKKFNISREDLGYLTFDEIKKALYNEKIPLHLIKERKINGCFIAFDLKTKKIQAIKLSKVYSHAMSLAKKLSNNNVVLGTVAQTGVVQGHVKIITGFHDIKKVQKGEILVANTTHPNYLPAMQKAAAFITNEGGVISHAAIVAREMKKPCIVGTKNATLILHDGDLVKVDANAGKVIILKKAG